MISLHGAALRLRLETQKIAAIILDDCAVEGGRGRLEGGCHSTNSINAMSAPSPRRWPMRKMRV